VPEFKAGKNKPEPDPKRDDTPEPSPEPPVRPTPAPKKIGERPDNLRRREEWFRKRSS